ncbi:MAG: ABC transporter substrate-binding protein [Patescibacteria group bacterium]
MNTLTKWILGIVVLAVIVWIGMSMSNKAPTETGPIKIGFISPLTGNAAVIGVQQKNAIQLAVNEINSSGGVRGRLLEMIYEDSMCDAKEAVSAVRKLIDVDGVKIILGDVCSAATLSAKSITEENKIIVFTWGSSPEITNQSKYIFRNSPSDDAAGSNLATVVYEMGFKTVGIITLNADFTNAFFGPFELAFTNLGGTITTKEVNVPDTTDFRTSVLKLKESNAEAIIVLGTEPKSTGIMVKQIRDGGLQQQLFSAYAFSSPVAAEVAGKENAKGLIFIDAPKLSSEVSSAKNFLEKYVAEFGESPQGSEFYAGAAYDSVYIISDALMECAEHDSDCIKKTLSGMTFSGVLGDYTLGEDGNVSGINYSVNTVE